jgi:hypothetical protein
MDMGCVASRLLLEQSIVSVPDAAAARADLNLSRQLI